jgi:starch synthase
MIAMRYGCVPVVRAAGGLRDTVTPDAGFIFEKAHVQSLSAGIRSALRVYPDREKWRQFQQAGMAKDFSWVNSAIQYFTLYQSLVREITPSAPNIP